MSEEQVEDFRETPVSGLDMELMLTNPKWGQEIPRGLKEKLKEKSYDIEVVGDKRKIRINETSLWEVLGFYTRDLRLGNLNYTEVKYCQYWLNLARDCLSDGYKKAFIASLSRAATVLELSQSKGGFLRKLFNRVEHYQHQVLEDKNSKKGLFGQKKDDGFGRR